MPARNPPPAAAVVVGVLIAVAVAVVVLNRAEKAARERKTDDPAPPPAFTDAHPQIQPLDRALALETAGRNDEAAAVLRELLDREPDNIDALITLRRVLPPDMKGELGDRLTKCARPSSNFDELLDDARTDNDEAAVAALFAGLEKVRPQDPRWGCAAIEKLVRAKQFTDATERFRTLHRAAMLADARSRLLHTFVHEMRQAGKGMDAYAAAPDPDLPTALLILAQRHENVLLEGNPSAPKDTAKEELRALVAAHRTRTPSDPALWYYEGVLLQGGGEFEKAAKVYADGMGKRPAPPRPDFGSTPRPGDWGWTYEMLRARRVECLCRLGNALRAYAEIGPPEDTFRQIAFELVKDKKADVLAELIAAHAKQFPTAPEVSYWTGELRFMKGEYAKAAESFAAFERASPKPSSVRWRAPERLVRAQLRGGDAAAARRAMEALPADRIPAALRMAVLAKADDVDGVAAILEFEVDVSGRTVWFYSDEDFAREIARPPFTALRAKYPDPRLKPGG